VYNFIDRIVCLLAWSASRFSHGFYRIRPKCNSNTYEVDRRQPCRS